LKLDRVVDESGIWLHFNDQLPRKDRMLCSDRLPFFELNTEGAS